MVYLPETVLLDVFLTPSELFLAPFAGVIALTNHQMVTPVVVDSTMERLESLQLFDSVPLGLS